MNRDEINYEKESGKSHERIHENNHEKESGRNHERIHENNHEKESAFPLYPPFSRYSIPPSSSSPSSSRHTLSSQYTIAPSQSRQAIFSSNVNLVHGVVSKYKIRDSYVREEAVSVGMEELWNCTERWKEEKGKFSTYAWRCVDGKVIVKKSIKS